VVLPRQFLKVSVLRPYFPGGQLNTFAPILQYLRVLQHLADSVYGQDYSGI
jgi:hypothetical protein